MTQIVNKREIKFKAWNNLHKHWMDRNYSSLYLDGELIVSEGESYNTYEEITLCQFTGLTDKNGKEIYEWDIVKAEDWPTLIDSTTGYVYFEDGAWKVEGAIPPLVHFASLEVIGNIFENPELITKQ